MKIGKDSFVSIDYALTVDSGELVDSSAAGEPLGFVFGAGQIVPGLEKGLEGMEAGQKARITVEPEEGYGRTRLELYRDIPLAAFPPDVAVRPGMAFEAASPRGPMRFSIKSIEGDKAVADFNHPLAGERLHFDVTVVGVRPATDREMVGGLDPGCGGRSGGCGGDSGGGCGCG